MIGQVRLRTRFVNDPNQVWDFETGASVACMCLI